MILISISNIISSSSLVAAVAVLATGLSYGQDLPEPPLSGGVLGGAPVDPEGLEKTIEEELDRYAKFDLDEVEKTVKAFLNSKTVADQARYIRDAKRVLPLMKKYYGGEEFQPEGFKEFERSEISFRGGFLTSLVETGDYLSSQIAVARVEGEKVSCRVDWESWVGFCEVRPGEMKLRNPAHPVLVRALVRADHYFNFAFDDDKKWDCYKLSFRNSEETFTGYAKMNSPAAKQLLGLRKNDQSSPYTLRIAYPPGARNKSQVEIVEVIEGGWIVGLSDKQKDGE